MANIKGRALQGLSRLLGTSGAAVPSPRQVDTDAPLTLVLDVGAGAHARSIWLQDGYALIEFSQTHAATGTVTSTVEPWEFIDALGATQFDNPVLDPSSTALWIVNTMMLLDTDVGPTGDFNTAGIFMRQNRLRRTGAGLTANSGYTGLVDFSNVVLPWNVPGGAAGLRPVRDSSPTRHLAGRIAAGPMRVADELVLISDSGGTGVMQINFNLLIFVGSDGAPPPNFGL